MISITVISPARPPAVLQTMLQQCVTTNKRVTQCRNLLERDKLKQRDVNLKNENNFYENHEIVISSDLKLKLPTWL